MHQRLWKYENGWENMKVKKDILNALKKAAPGRAIRLPRDLDFEYSGKTLTITIYDKGVGYGYPNSKGNILHLNMQNDGAAFEGWAIVIRTYWNKSEQYNVKLKADCALPNVRETFIEKLHPEVSSGHYGRFLYRAYKFREEFEWFELDEEIEQATNYYMDLVTDKERKVTNHLPKGEAGNNRKPEIRAEKAFSEHPDELVKITYGRISGDVNRQLNCWLESGDGKYQFLTDGKSAIDLWNMSNSTLHIFELKAKNNIKVGIISELFFYSEYCTDFYGKYARFESRNPKDTENVRGYADLYNGQTKGKINSVEAYFLADNYHPLVNEETVKTLNANRKQIKYTILKEYNLEKMLSYTKTDG